jgi:zinc protease
MPIGRRAFALLGIVVFSASLAWGQKTAPTQLPGIKFTEFTLPNGLRVILHEDHSTPIVAVNVWYHVGSKNEVVGRTGFAHLFEHMMFQGSGHYDNDYFRPIQEAGGTLNGSTNTDRTNYWEVVPSNYLEMALWLESDRMGYLPDAMTMEKLNNQRDVVKNEKRQNYDNQPYGLSQAAISELLYPKDHPYNWLTIGSLDDLTAASMEDVKDFFRRFYVPNNASLVVAGDINPKQARQLVEKYFGPLKQGPAKTPVNAPQPKIDHEIRASMEDNVSVPRLSLIWMSMPAWAPDEAALDTVATVLSGGKTSRLYKALVYDQKIAQNVFASNQTREIAGQFQIVVTPKQGHTVEEMEKAVDAEVAKFKTEGPTADEMTRAFNGREAQTIFGMQSIGGFGGKSDQLNSYATFLGKPDYFQADLERYRKLTPADVQKAANTYLTDKRLVYVVKPRPRDQMAGGGPGRRSAAADVPTSTDAPKAPKTDQSAKGGLYVMPKPGPDPRFTLPKIERRKLSNGLDVLVVQHHELPVVNMNLVVKTGGAADPQDRAGLASLTASLIDEGTATHSGPDLANQLGAIGANLNSNAGWDASNVSLTTLTRQLDPALAIFADVVMNPAFPESELELQRDQRLGALRQQRDNANAISGNVLSRVLYPGNHPYGHALIGDATTVKAIQQSDVQKFYQTYYHPNNAALIVVGDVTPDEIVAKLEKALSGWTAAEVPATTVAMGPAREAGAIYLVDKPGAAQSVITIGQIGVDRSTADYFPLQVMNTMLGGQFVSRVNLNLREDKGYTYGARTQFDYRRGAGPFLASAGVQTAVTKESVVEFMKELRGIRGEIPVTEAELSYNKQSLITGYPRGFETPGGIGNRLSDVVVYGLPDSYFNNYIRNVNAVTLADIQRVANKYLDPSKMAILIVGDRRTVETGLRSIDGWGSTLTVLDPDGKPVTVGGGAGQR